MRNKLEENLCLSAVTYTHWPFYYVQHASTGLDPLNQFSKYYIFNLTLDSICLFQNFFRPTLLDFVQMELLLNVS